MGTVEALLTPSAQDKPRARPALPATRWNRTQRTQGRGARGPSGDWPGAARRFPGPSVGLQPLRRPRAADRGLTCGRPSKGSLSPAGLTGQHPSLGSKGPGPNMAKTQKPVAGALYQRI